VKSTFEGLKMANRINRFVALLLLILLSPIVLPIRLYRWLTGTGKKPVYENTLEGDPLSYTGERPVVVALWATWASVWNAATARIVVDLQKKFAGRCEFVYVEATSRGVLETYGADIVPTVLVIQNRQEVGRFVNLLDGEEFERCLAERLAVAGTE
jgi:thioredoxin-like negative regulator of GroEL